MKRLKLFFACLLMAVLSIGQVWGADPVSVTINFGTGTGCWSAHTTASYTDDDSRAWTRTCDVSNMSGQAGYSQFGKSGVTPNVELYATAGSNIKVTAFSVTMNGASGDSQGTIYLYKRPAEGDDVQLATASVTSSSAVTCAITTDATFASTDKLVVSYKGTSKGIRVTTLTYTYTEAVACTKTASVSKVTPVNGDFNISATEVCGDGDGGEVTISNIEPATGYTLDEVSVTVGTYNALTGKVTGITDDTEITVTFKALPKYTVSFNTGAGNPAVSPIPEATAGAGIELPAGPTPTCTGWTFAGWKETSAVTEPTTTAPTLLAAGTNYKPAANCTLYAVYKQEAGSSTGTIDYTITFDDNSSDASSDISEEAFMNYITTNKSKVSSVSDIVKCYKGATGLKLSSKKNNGSFVLTLAESAAITKVVLNTKKKSTTQGASYEVTVGSEAFSTSSSLSKDDFVDVEFTGTKTTSNSLSIASLSSTSEGSDSDGRVAWLKSITVYYEGTVVTYNYLSTPTCTCTQLDAPTVSVPDGDLTYNSAKLTWEAVANADKYLVKFNGVDQEATSNLYFDATGLDAATTYTYQVKALAEEGQDDWCDGAFSAEANFTTEPAPSATLTLMENGNVVAGGSHTVSVPFALPKEVTHTCGKTFVGWDADAECNHAPTYAPGANFTFADQTGVTLYAVYANVAAGTTTNIAYTGSTTTNMTGNNEAADLVDATDVTGWSVVGYKGGGSNFPGLNKDGTIRLYYNASGNSYIEVTAPQTIASVALTMGELNNVIVKVGGNTVAISDGVYPIGATSFTIINGNTTNAQAHIQNIAVNFPGAQSNWATTCVDPLENPTFSLDPVVAPVNDKYEEAINVVITNNAGEGTIYYTTNGQNPTSASTSYTGAITLNTCGIKTIKAIVISDNNQSEVVTATYEMAIPIPSVSAADPYTEAEAVAVIDGGCYNNEDVYVTGTVASNGAAWYQNSGTYTITLENGFKFYYFYEGANEQSFTDNYIAAGDVLVAKGKLEKSGNTYRLAQGCYLVSRTPAQKTPIDSDIDNPITVADALGYIDQAATYDLTNVYVKGVASEDPDNQGTFNIHDADVDNTFQIYKGVLSQALIDAGVEVEENDTVIAVGKLTKYYSTYEMAEGGEIVVVKKYVAPTVAVTGVEVDETATVKVGKTVQLTATVQPTNATNQNVTWSVKTGSETFAEVSETGLVTGLAEGVAIIIVTTEDGGFTDECTVTVNPIAPANTDIITAEGIGVEGNSYMAWTGKTGFGTSSVYAGNSTNATNPNAGALQLRYNTASDKQSGIVLTESNGMVLKGLSVSVKSGSNTLNVYAKATAYSGYADLYSDDENVRGKLIGTVSATGAMTLEEGVSYDDNYQYIGMRSASGALYLDDITITWGDAVTPPEPSYTEVRNGLTDGWYYTMCLDKAVTAVKAGSIWKVLSKAANGNDVILEEVTGTLDAGRPYIFRAAASTLEVAYTGDAVGAPITTGNNGLIGSFSQTEIAQSPNNFIIYNNELYYVNSEKVYVGANRAYLDMTGVPAYSNEPQQGNAPRRRVVMTVHGEQTATGCENINASETPVKMIIDGQLYILRGEKMYDATGKLVK